MANTYDTRALPLGTPDPRALYDNASNADEVMNGPKVSWADRFGNVRKTWAGIETDFSAFILASGFEPVHFTYVAGFPLTVQRPTQLIDYAGSVRRVKTPASIPATLSATWAMDLARLVDVGNQSLRQNLAAQGGPALIGDPVSGTVAQALISLRSQTLNSVASMRTYNCCTYGHRALLSRWLQRAGESCASRR